MPQSAKLLKRRQNPARVYQPRAYQRPPDDGSDSVEVENRGSGAAVKLLLFILVVVVGLLYLKGQGMDPLQAVRDQWLSGGNVTPNRPAEGAATPDSVREVTVINGSVAVDNLYLREGPGLRYQATYLLPYNWPLSITREPETDSEGETWVRVRLDTNQGPQEGWVNRKYIRTPRRS